MNCNYSGVIIYTEMNFIYRTSPLLKRIGGDGHATKHQRSLL